MSALTLSLFMSTVIEDTPAVAVDQDAHVTQLDFVDKIPDGNNGRMPMIDVTESTSPLPQSTSPEPAVFSSSTPSTPSGLPEESHQPRISRYRSTIEVGQILF